MDADASLMDLVVQKYHVFRIEVSGHSDTGKTRQAHQLIRISHHHRFCLTTDSVPNEQLIFLFSALALPVAQRDQACEDQTGKQEHGDAPSHEIRAGVYCELAVPRADAVFKILLVLMLVLIIWNLTAGFMFLARDRGTTTRTVHALSWRIGLSIVLVLLLMAGFATGVIRPHSAMPVQPTAAGPRSE